MKIAIILGSESDLDVLKKSKAIQVLDDVGIKYDIVIISAHRHHHTLENYCHIALSKGCAVFIAAAGMAAALPGAIAAICADSSNYPLVIGVPLPSMDFANGMDALLSMIRMPPGVPVAVCGVGESGFKNAAIAACEILAVGDETIRRNLKLYFRDNTKPARTSGVDILS